MIMTLNTKISITGLAFVLILSLCVVTITAASENNTPVSHADKAVAVLTSLQNGNQSAIELYISPEKYIQHNLAFPDGRDALLSSLSILKESGTTVNPVRVLSDGDYVAVQSEYFLFGKNQIGFDIFRFENGTIVEHWDNLQDVVNETKSGHSMTDGPVEITDTSATESNKALIQNFVDDILIGGKYETLASYYNGDAYIQHNPGVPDGVSGLSAALGEMIKAGNPMTYSRSHLLIGEGNFVLVVSEGKIGEQANTFYDLFRVQDGKIAEHWDVIEPVPAKDQWKNQNGKF